MISTALSQDIYNSRRWPDKSLTTGSDHRKVRCKEFLDKIGARKIEKMTTKSIKGVLYEEYEYYKQINENFTKKIDKKQ